MLLIVLLSTNRFAIYFFLFPFLLQIRMKIYSFTNLQIFTEYFLTSLPIFFFLLQLFLDFPILSCLLLPWFVLFHLFLSFSPFYYDHFSNRCTIFFPCISKTLFLKRKNDSGKFRLTKNESFLLVFLSF